MRPSQQDRKMQLLERQGEAGMAGPQVKGNLPRVPGMEACGWRFSPVGPLIRAEGLMRLGWQTPAHQQARMERSQ